MKAKAIQILKFLVFTGIGVVLVWFIVKDLSDKDKSEILSGFKKANYWWLFGGFVVGIISHILRSIRWQMMLEAVDKKPRFDTAFFALIIGYMANLAIPRLGEVSRCGILNQHENIPMEKSLGTVVTERIIDTIFLGLSILLLLATQYKLITDFVFSTLNSKSSSGVAPSSMLNEYKWIILFCLIALFICILIVISKTEKGKEFILKIKTLIDGFMSGILSVFKLKNKWLFVCYSIAIWLLYLLSVIMSFKAIEQTAHLGMDAGLSVLVMGTFAYILVQGGIGAYQLIVMQTLLLYQVSSNTGYTIGWLSWASQTIAFIIIGILSIVILSFRKKKDLSVITNA